jgi:hypothetical protein
MQSKSYRFCRGCTQGRVGVPQARDQPCQRLRRVVKSGQGQRRSLALLYESFHIKRRHLAADKSDVRGLKGLVIACANLPQQNAQREVVHRRSVALLRGGVDFWCHPHRRPYERVGEHGRHSLTRTEVSKHLMSVD